MYRVARLKVIRGLMRPDQNPYLPSVSVPGPPRRLASTRCPVCDEHLSRIRLVLPIARCCNCGRRIRLRSSWASSSLSTITAVACFASLMYFEATPDRNGLLFGVHALVFIFLGAVWFHLLGCPSLAGWLGHASQATLDRERAKYRAEIRQEQLSNVVF